VRSRNTLAALVAPSVWVVCMAAACGYDSEVLDHPVTELKAELRALATAMLVAAAVGYLLRAEVARNYLVATVLLVAILIPIGRFAGRRVVVLLRARGKCLQRVLFIGHERSVHVIIRQAAQQRGQGLDIVGACVPSGRSDLIQAAGVPVLGDLSQALEVALREALAPLVDHPHVAEVRQTGMIAAIEFVKDRASGERYDWRERRGLAAYQYALAQGALLRPVGNVIYLMPPYVITPDEIDWLAGVARGALDTACA